MVAKAFKLDLDEELVLQLLGAAIVLRWSVLPTGLQDELVQQVQAMAGNEPHSPEQDEHISQILKRIDSIDGALLGGETLRAWTELASP